MKARIIGAGAIGAVIAAKLSGCTDTALVADKERKERYSNGIIVNGRNYRIPVYTADEGSVADFALFAVKNFQLYDAIEEARPFIGPDTIIMSLLNGIDAEPVLSDAFGGKNVLYAFITGVSSVHQGIETTCFSDGTVIFGDKNNIRTEQVERIASLFGSAGISYRIPDDIKHEKWWKFMLNTCFNTLSAILLADYAAISENRDFIRLVRLIAREVQTVASAEGVMITQSDIERMIGCVTDLRDHGKTSMLQDVLAHRDTENKYFAGAVSRLGKKHSIPTPYSDFIQIMLEAKRHVLNF